MLDNNIQITVRIPETLNTALSEQSKNLGLTKTSMIRYYIHEFLSDKPIDISAVDTSSYDGKPYRLVLKLNEPTSKLLKDTAEKYSLSVNVTLIRVCASIVEYYSKS